LRDQHRHENVGRHRWVVVELAEEQLTGNKAEPLARRPESLSKGEDSPCRSETYIDRTPGSWTLVALLSMATAGALAGRSIILHAPDAARFVQDNKAALQLWAGLIGFLCGYGLAAGAS